jgi:hypothetical protein
VFLFSVPDLLLLLLFVSVFFTSFIVVVSVLFELSFFLLLLRFRFDSCDFGSKSSDLRLSHKEQKGHILWSCDRVCYGKGCLFVPYSKVTDFLISSSVEGVSPITGHSLELTKKFGFDTSLFLSITETICSLFHFWNSERQIQVRERIFFLKKKRLKSQKRPLV